MRKIVSNQISPNLFLSDFFYAGFKTILGNKCSKEIFEQIFSTKSFFLCNNARSALWKICELSEIPKTKKTYYINNKSNNRQQDKHNTKKL